MQKNWTFSVRGSQISAPKRCFEPKTAILAKESYDFSARIVAVRASRTSRTSGASIAFRTSAAIRAFCSNQPICYLSTRYVICLLHPGSRHITQAVDYLRVSKPPLIDILETWISRRLRYSEGLQRIRLKGFDFESRAFLTLSCDCSRIGHSDDDARFCSENLASWQKLEQEPVSHFTKL